jgi:hypothetical protein
MKAIACGLFLWVLFVACSACNGEDDDNGGAAPADDDDEDDDDDDASPADDDDMAGVAVPQTVLYGFDQYTADDPPWYTPVLSIYQLVGGIRWVAAVGEEVDSQAEDMWGASAKGVWVVGRDNAMDRGMIYRYNGSQWQRQDLEPTYDGLRVRYLRSVSGSSASNVYVLGSDVDYQVEIEVPSLAKGMVILNYDGSDWRPSYAAHNSLVDWTDLRDLWTAPDGETFAVGQWRNYIAGTHGYLVVHNDSGAWVESKGDDAAGLLCRLVTVWGAAADDVFAAGECEDQDYRYRVLVMHYDGNEWQEMDMHGLAGPRVADIGGASGQEVYLAVNSLYAVMAGIYFYNGGEWSAQDEINKATEDHGRIESIWATSDSKLYIVNDQIDVYDHKTGAIRKLAGPPMTRLWIPPSGEGD